ncbi:uncharacterized protein C2845_PM08G18360 [Panicum miliaceum]|uniref:Uncharacterized protein n=1 Tax=Panicum miliaceum TaxID=4540 RepID=A0A3L6QWW6_PANMI|nr:uncharacterized protein C2845_PM08G18360 [Panicum miliaceum]
MTAQISLASLTGTISGPHWEGIKELLPVYMAITTSDVGNGTSTSFWSDHWLPKGPLVHALPALHSHALNKDATVGDVLAQPLHVHFVARLNRAASAELAVLEELVSDTELTGGLDTRRCPLADKDETPGHLILHHDVAAQLWANIGIDIPPSASVSDI